MDKINELKLKISDLEQYIFSKKTDAKMENERNLNFLKEIKSHLKKWEDKNDITSKQYAIKMIDDWIDELNAL
jgi:hypothetical protein